MFQFQHRAMWLLRVFWLRGGKLGMCDRAVRKGKAQKS